MGFISYSRDYLINKLAEYESRYQNGAPAGTVHEAKVLLKMLEDIRDEGYTYAYDSFSAEFDCINRLKSFIRKNNDRPFELVNYSIGGNPNYSDTERTLDGYLRDLEKIMEGPGAALPETPALFYDLVAYAKSCYENADTDTAYVFLLRDTLLAYLAFRKWDTAGKLSLYPFPIGRKYLSFFSDAEDGGTTDPNGDCDELYNALHGAIFAALSEKPADFHAFRILVRERMHRVLGHFPEAAASLTKLLGQIPHGNIMVIESGYIGTIPLLLSCLDQRVDFRLFTTIPYFYNMYKGRFFIKAFEKIRLFETIQCQDALFQLAAVDDGQFRVSQTNHEPVIHRAHMELSTWNRIVYTYT